MFGIYIMKNATMQFLQYQAIWNPYLKSLRQNKKEVFFANLITVTSTVIDSGLLVHFDLEGKSKWVACVQFGSRLDIIEKICHENVLAFTSIFGMHDIIIFVLYIQQCNFERGLSCKKIESHGHNFIYWWLPLGSTNLISGRWLWTKKTLRTLIVIIFNLHWISIYFY